MTTKPGQYDIAIYQGSTYSQQFTWKDQNGAAINLTGYSARMKVRPGVDSATVLLDLTTANAKITLGGVAGTITVNLTDVETAALAAMLGVYDLELISGGGVVTRLLQGNLIVSNEVTR